MVPRNAGQHRDEGRLGPSLAGRYLVRQIAVLSARNGSAVVAMAAEPDSGSFADGTRALTDLAGWLQSHLDALPAAHFSTRYSSVALLDDNIDYERNSCQSRSLVTRGPVASVTTLLDCSLRVRARAEALRGVRLGRCHTPGG